MKRYPVFSALALGLYLGAAYGPVPMCAQQVLPILGSPVAPSGGTKVSVSDNFNRANGSLGANWTQAPADGFSVWNNALSTANASYPELAYWSANTFSANQYGQMTVPSITGNWVAVGVAVRVSAGNCYAASWHDTNVLDLHKVVSGTDTTIGTTSTVAAGDTIRIEVSGTSISVKKNGTVVIGPLTDSSLASGSAGVYGNGSGAQGDNWAGGDL